MIEELKADNQPYQDELAFVKKVQRCADIARRDREMPENRVLPGLFRRKKRKCRSRNRNRNLLFMADWRRTRN